MLLTLYNGLTAGDVRHCSTRQWNREGVVSDRGERLISNVWIFILFSQKGIIMNRPYRK